MKRNIIYRDSEFTITLREVLFSVIIFLLLLTIGFFIAEAISSKSDEYNQVYEQALKIEDNKELFEYGIRTDVGNAFVSGTLKAVDPVSIPDIDGEYISILKIEEIKTKHTKVVTDYNDDGEVVGTHTEVYYTWDKVDSENFNCTTISFLDNNFDYGVIKLPSEKYHSTIKVSSIKRYKYYVRAAEYYGTIYAKLADKTLSNAIFINNANTTEAVEYMCKTALGRLILFWISWIIVICVVIYAFYCLENNWIEG